LPHAQTSTHSLQCRLEMTVATACTLLQRACSSAPLFRAPLMAFSTPGQPAGNPATLKQTYVEVSAFLCRQCMHPALVVKLDCLTASLVAIYCPSSTSHIIASDVSAHTQRTLENRVREASSANDLQALIHSMLGLHSVPAPLMGTVLSKAAQLAEQSLHLPDKQGESTPAGRMGLPCRMPLGAFKPVHSHAAAASVCPASITLDVGGALTVGCKLCYTKQNLSSLAQL
jgi:hypothetical protein